MKTRTVMQDMQDDASCYKRQPDSSLEATRDVKMLQFESNHVLHSPIFRLFEKTNHLLDVQLPHLRPNCNSTCKCNQHAPFTTVIHSDSCCHWKLENLEMGTVELQIIQATLRTAPRIFWVKLFRQISGDPTWRDTQPDTPSISETRWDLLVFFLNLGLSENSVPLHPMVNDHYPY